MSYNGIGLASVRGSGTSGYVTTNKFHVRASRMAPRDGPRDDLPGGGVRKPNKEILEHNRKRAVEVKLLMLRESLEEKGCVCAGVCCRACRCRKAGVCLPRDAWRWAAVTAELQTRQTTRKTRTAAQP
jgi:hypothetical protein